MKYKKSLPEWANYDSKLSPKYHVCCTSKHKMRIQHVKCTNKDCLCTGRCKVEIEVSFGYISKMNLRDLLMSFKNSSKDLR